MMKFDGNKGRFLAIILSVFVLIVICVAAFFYQNEKITFQNISMLKQKEDKNGSNYLKLQFQTNLGTQNYLMLEMAIPYENKTQYADLSQKIDKIKSDMLTDIDQKAMNKWVEERDFDAIKSELLNVINKHTKRPIEHIYFDSFLYQ
jgi:flagellar basal body-associated protein FliL